MKLRKIPMRRCVGCMQSKPKKELVRLVADADGRPAVDLTGKANGRGVYLCPNRACLLQARKKKAIGRGLQIDVAEGDYERLLELWKDEAEDAGKN